MKENFILENKGFIYFILIVIAFLTLYPLFFTGFATADDLHYYLIARTGRVFESTSYFAQVAGRFYFYIVMPLYSLPYIIDSNVVVKIFQFIPLIVCFLLFAKIIFIVTKSNVLPFIFLLTLLFTMQISRHTSLFLAYPFYFTFSFSILLISYLLLLRFYENLKIKFLILSSVFFLLGLLFYESYLLFLLFFGITIFYYNTHPERSRWQNIKTVLLHCFPFLIVGLLYLAVYFIFRIYHPSQYPGTSFSMKYVTVGSFFNVLWQLSFSSFPLTVYETSHTLFWDKSELVAGYSPVILNLILNAKVEWLVKGFLVSFIGFQLLMKSSPLKFKKLLAGILMAVLLIFLPHIPLALTEKYTFFTEKGQMIGYVTTFFSLFGTLLVISLLLNFAVNLLNFNKIVKMIVAGVLVCGFFICSVLTDFSNYSIAKDVRGANLRFYAVDELLKSKEFKSIPVGTPFYGKNLWENPSYSAAGLTEQNFNWFEYFQAKTGNAYAMGRDDKIFLDYSKSVPQVPYFITSRQAERTEDIMVVMARMEPLAPQDSIVTTFANHAAILYYSPYKTFTLSFRIMHDIDSAHFSMKINHIEEEMTPGKTIEVTIFNTKKHQAATIFTLQIPGIDLNSINISNMVNRDNKIFYL